MTILGRWKLTFIMHKKYYVSYLYTTIYMLQFRQENFGDYNGRRTILKFSRSISRLIYLFAKSSNSKLLKF